MRERLSESQKVIMDDVTCGSNSGWLSATPVAGCGLLLDPWTWRASVGNRFGKVPEGMAGERCPNAGCDKDYDLEHVLRCSRRWTERHDEVNMAVSRRIMLKPKMRRVPDGR